jgi:hypothetical protein
MKYVFILYLFELVHVFLTDWLKLDLFDLKTKIQ